MTVAVARGVRRFDVACALESAFKNHDWKGEEHYKGVFFTDTNGYCVNKVLAVRIAHEEQAPEVFYSFAAKSVDEKVMVSYPFREMNTRPKKHHLLSEQRELKRQELDSLFKEEGKGNSFEVEGSHIFKIIDERVPNKRERDRTQIHFIQKADAVRLEIVRFKKHERELISKKELDLANYIYEGTEVRSVAKLNANSLYTVLQLFPEKSQVSFCISHDRIKITGNLSTLEGEEALVEVVLSQMKG